jgi:hypothetical protein
MIRIVSAVVSTMFLSVIAPGLAAEEPQLQRLATCKDSWYEWKDDAVRTGQFAKYFRANFVEGDGGGFKPTTATRLFGFPVVQVFPQSVGMAVGFSVLVTGNEPKVRRTFEKQLGKAMRCSTSDGMKSCELKIAEKKVAVTMAVDNGKAGDTLIGCYYFYEK